MKDYVLLGWETRHRLKNINIPGKRVLTLFGIIMSNIVRKSLFLIFVLFLSCTPEKDNYIVVYFDNGIIDDSPLGFPDFSTILHKSPEIILELKDEQIDKVSYLKLDDAIKDGLAHKKENTLI